MFLHEVYRPECIKLDLEAEDKDEVFEELTDHFCVAAKNGGREELLRVLREREAKMSTGIRRGIAIPHGKTGAVSEVAGAGDFPEGDRLRRPGRGAGVHHFHVFFPRARNRVPSPPPPAARGIA